MRARAWTREHGEDIPEVSGWHWQGRADAESTSSDTGGDDG